MFCMSLVHLSKPSKLRRIRIDQFSHHGRWSRVCGKIKNTLSTESVNYQSGMEISVRQWFRMKLSGFETSFVVTVEKTFIAPWFPPDAEWVNCKISKVNSFQFTEGPMNSMKRIPDSLYFDMLDHGRSGIGKVRLLDTWSTDSLNEVIFVKSRLMIEGRRSILKSYHKAQ